MTYFGLTATTIKISNILQLPVEARAAAAERTRIDPITGNEVTVFDPVTGEVRPVFRSIPNAISNYFDPPEDHPDHGGFLLVSPAEAPLVSPPPPPGPTADERLTAARADLAAAEAALEDALEAYVASNDPADKVTADGARSHLAVCRELVQLLSS